MSLYTQDIRSFDWNKTPLGPRSAWPHALEAIFAMMLGSPIAMCATWGKEGTLLYNSAYAPILKLRHPSAIGQPIAEVWPDVWEEISPLIDRVLSGESVSFKDLHLVMTRNGFNEDTWWSFSYIPLWNNGEVFGFLNIATETTKGVVSARERAIADQKIRARNEELERQIVARNEAVRRAQIDAERVNLALAAGAIVGTFVWNVKTDSFDADDSFAHAFGLNQDLAKQGLDLASVVETVHPDDLAGLAAAITSAVGRGGPYMHEYRVKRRDGLYYWVEANGMVQMDKHGSPERFPGVLIDLTKRREIEAERDRVVEELRELNTSLEQRVIERTRALVDAQEALRQSQKMEAVGQLTGGLAHDFNNLLAGISGSLQLMQLRALKGQFKDFERYIQMAMSGVKRASSLTHRLLAFSRRQTLDPRPADVNRLVYEMRDLIERTVGPSIAINVVTTDALWPALVDSSQLENALLNLCINARDAMPKGGSITIETAKVSFDELTATNQDIAPGKYLSLSVTDSGSGMEPEVLNKVFEPFFTTKPLGEGTGLGLSMVYGFAKQSDGQVSIQSEVGMGTTVTIYLPRHIGNVEDDSHRNRESPTLRPILEQRQTILIVEDEPVVRALVMESLSDLGYNALEASDSATGLKILQSNVRIDLLISDVGLPGGLNGRQMADAALQGRPGLKVLFITGYAENAATANSHLLPGMQVMTKPFDLQELASRITSMAEK